MNRQDCFVLVIRCCLLAHWVLRCSDAYSSLPSPLFSAFTSSSRRTPSFTESAIRIDSRDKPPYAFRRPRVCFRVDNLLNGYETNNGKSTRHQKNSPKHVAVICDGNSRWAKARGVPTSLGHATGAERMLEMLEELKKDPMVECCTLYGFSSENWKRDRREIDEIFHVMEQTAVQFVDRAVKEGVRVKIIGDLEDERIPGSLRSKLRRLEQKTLLNTNSTNLTVCIAVNYGGRHDIVNAVRKIMAEQAVSGEKLCETITEDDIARHLWTNDIPDPDLIIRTAGEQRLSNFLLFDAAYTELYFTDTLWPDFDTQSLEEALEWYRRRDRRYGGRPTTTTTTEALP